MGVDEDVEGLVMEEPPADRQLPGGPTFGDPDLELVILVGSMALANAVMQLLLSPCQVDVGMATELNADAVVGKSKAMTPSCSAAVVVGALMLLPIAPSCCEEALLLLSYKWPPPLPLPLLLQVRSLL